MMTIAAIASTIGTARGTTQGSCRPFASRMPSLPPKSTVFCACPIVAGGLKPTRKKIWAPFDIPPCTPPELLVLVFKRFERGLSPFVMASGGALGEASTPDWLGATGTEDTKASLWIEPGTAQPPKPEPISKPFVAGILSMPWARQASNLSKHGSPRPTGQLRITQVTVPPIESFLSRNSAILSAIRSAASLLGQRTGRKSGWSTSSRVIVSKSFRNVGFVAGVGCVDVGGKSSSSPTDETKATISTPWTRERYFSAMAPAATRAIVSRAELRPPPLLARTPYFSWYV